MARRLPASGGHGVEGVIRHSKHRGRGGYSVQDVLDNEVQG
jgi:hypothetical protein